MGDMADAAIDEMLNQEDAILDYKLGKMSEEEAYERGIIDEFGGLLNANKTTAHRIAKARGPGKCPRCGGETILKEGKFGEFYGCTKFPKCKGSRNARG